MNQEETGDRIICTIMDNAEELSYLDILDFIFQAYAVGFDEGRLQGAHEKPVIQYDRWDYKLGDFDSATLAARAVGVTKGSISKAALGKTKTCKGYKWRYKNE